MARDEKQFVLPTLVFGVVEVRRLSRELESLEDFMRSTAIRESGSPQEAMPRASRLLDATAQDNHLNLLQPEDRKLLADFLNQVQKSAPTIHMSFASDPSAAFLEKVVSWLRINIHPLVLVRLGLQPSIAAGCVLRTANHAYDFSLRHRFTEERKLLLYSLEAESQTQPATAPAPPAATPVEVIQQ